MGPRHRNVEDARVDQKIPGTVQGGRCERSADGPEFGLCTRSCKRRHGFRIKIDDANEMIFGVGDVERSPVESHPLWMIEFRLRERSVGSTDSAVADHVEQ